MSINDKPSKKDIEEFEEVFKESQREWEKSLRVMPLKNDTCIHLLECYLDKKCYTSKKKSIPSSFLHICANPPPCEDNINDLKITQSRPWCKNNGLKLDTDPFDKNAKDVIQIYKKVEAEREKRLKKVKPDEKKKIEEVAKNLEDLKTRYENLEKKSNTPVVSKMIDDNIEKRFENLMRGDKIDPIKASEILQTQKAKNSSEMHVLTLTKNITEKISKDFRKGDEERKRKESKEEEEAGLVDETKTQKMFAEIMKAMNATNSRLEALENLNKTIDVKQDQIIHTTKDIREQQELQKYINVWYKSKYGVMKKILSAPFEAFNIIVLAPARYAFWHFFGKYWYLVYGLFMLLLLSACVLTAFNKLHNYHPEITAHLLNAFTYSRDLAIDSGSLLVQWMSPMISESFKDIARGTYAYGTMQLNNLYLWIVEMFKAILNNVAGMVGEKILSSMPSIPGMGWFK